MKFQAGDWLRADGLHRTWRCKGPSTNSTSIATRHATAEEIAAVPIRKGDWLTHKHSPTETVECLYPDHVTHWRHATPEEYRAANEPEDEDTKSQPKVSLAKSQTFGPKTVVTTKVGEKVIEVERGYHLAKAKSEIADMLDIKYFGKEPTVADKTTEFKSNLMLTDAETGQLKNVAVTLEKHANIQRLQHERMDSIVCRMDRFDSRAESIRLSYVSTGRYASDLGERLAMVEGERRRQGRPETLASVLGNMDPDTVRSVLRTVTVSLFGSVTAVALGAMLLKWAIS